MKMHHKTQSGAAMLFFIIFFVLTSSALTFLLSRTTYSDLRAVNSLLTSKQSYLTADSALEEVVFKMMKGGGVGATSTFDTLVGKATTTVSYDSILDIYTIRSASKVGRANRISVVELSPGAGSAFNYGLQTGNGGFRLVNTASITGNAFSNGTIVGQGNSLIKGDVISAGPSGLISKITATGTARANTLDDSVISGDAYYNVVGVPSTVNGVRHTPAAIIGIEPLPIEDAKIEEWKNGIITSGGLVIPATSCSGGWYEINSNVNIGNVKIECNLRIKKQGPSTTITLTGPIWVVGNIELVSGPVLQVSSTLGRQSVQLIADNPANRLTSSKIGIFNSTEFKGSGHPSSFIMMLSQNNSAELGGTEKAIDIGQSSIGDLILYAGHGLVDIGNSIELKSVSGYKINIGNSSDITYDTGLSSVLFTGGPGGGYVISDWYQE